MFPPYYFTQELVLVVLTPPARLQPNVCIYYSNRIHVCTFPGRRQVGKREKGEGKVGRGQEREQEQDQEQEQEQG